MLEIIELLLLSLLSFIALIFIFTLPGKIEAIYFKEHVSRRRPFGMIAFFVHVVIIISLVVISFILQMTVQVEPMIYLLITAYFVYEFITNKRRVQYALEDKKEAIDAFNASAKAIEIVLGVNDGPRLVTIQSKNKALVEKELTALDENSDIMIDWDNPMFKNKLYIFIPLYVVGISYIIFNLIQLIHLVI